jgi:soluble cytochrome b562
MKKITRILQFSLLAMVIASFSPAARAVDSALEKEMKNINQNTKALKKSVGEPAKKTEALAEIGRMIKSAEKAKTLTPKKTAEIPEADRVKFLADFQKQIDVLIAQFKQIEADLTADKTQEAKADFAQIGGIKREGHEKFAAKE